MSDREVARTAARAARDTPARERPRTPESSSARRQPLAALAAQQAAIGNQAVLARLADERPAGRSVQHKLEMSAPTDAHEREADRIADAVMAMPEPVAGGPDTEDVEEEPASLARQPDPVLDADVEDDPEDGLEAAAVAARLDRQAEPTDDLEESEELVATKAPTGAPQGSALSPGTGAAIERSRGAGHPLDRSHRAFFEPRLGRDLSGVKVHTDPGAARLASGMGARAFTVGRDVYFAQGRYQPGTEAGRSLLAHELAHTVQQQPGAKVQRAAATHPPRPARVGERVQRDADGSGTATDVGGAAEPLRPVFHVPQVKARHVQLYQAWAGGGRLERRSDFDRGDPNQREGVWIPAVSAAMASSARSVLESDAIGLRADSRDLTIRPKGGGGPAFTYEGTRDAILRRLAVPGWDRSGALASFDVDHIVELQVAGWPGASTGNELENMELLVSRANASAGGKTRWNVLYAVAEELEASGAPHTTADARAYVENAHVAFREARLGTGRFAGSMRENSAQWWTRDEILAGDHLAEAEAVNTREVGGADEFALFSPLTLEPGGEQRGGRALLGAFAHDADTLDFALRGRDQTRVAGIRMNQISLDSGYTGAGDSSGIGSVQAEWALPDDFQAEGAEAFSLPLRKMPGNAYAGYLGDVPEPALEFGPLSPIRFESMTVDAGGLAATGRLDPSIPLLSRLPIEVRLRGASLEFWAIYTAEDIELPFPGLHIDEAYVGVFYSTSDGFGAEGGLEFTVDRLGQGTLTVGVSGAGGLEVEGGFAFDSSLFDEASIAIWYRDGAFGGAGVLAITDPTKVPGVRSARVTATVEGDRLEAEGRVVPAIPGVQQADLSVAYSETEGLAIGGALDLSSDVPGIQSGSVDATVTKVSDAEGWKLAARGQARPSIPGIDSTIDITYDDGILTAAATAAYDRGFLSGSLEVGATNQAVDDEGNPTGEPGDRLRAYGGGALRLQLAPWLEATAGVRITPDAEVEVTGRIGLPSSLEVFPARRFDHNLFSVDLDIPILGVTVPVIRQRIGIFATIGGGLDLTAGFGPGELRELGLEITYNPDREDETEVTGGAEFFVPADAGLRLYVRGALGAGIPVVSASLGLEVGGQLGIEGAVRAGVEVAWTPTTGIQLDAEAEIFAEPVFRFDITGFALVEASVRIWSWELYSKRWNLANVEYGSGLRLGATFPIHYVEGEPFDLSLDDVELQVPEIEPMALLEGLVRQVV